MSHYGKNRVIWNDEATNLHYSIGKNLGLRTTENWYTYVPKSACTVWNQAVRREVLPNRADVIIENKKDNRCSSNSGQEFNRKAGGKETENRNLSLEINLM
jgi:hypothetical protein